MKLGRTAPGPTGYFLRQSVDEAERGPFSQENLRDLAEFQHVTPDSIIRPENEIEARPLRTFPELFSYVFPQKKGFTFKAPVAAADPESDLPEIDVRDLFCCAPGESTPEIAAEKLVSAAPIPPQKPTPSDVQQLLSASAALAKSRRTPSVKQARAPFRFKETFLIIRWLIALLLIALAVTLWQTLPPFWALLLSLPLFGFAASLTAGDILDWFLDWLSTRFMPEPSKRVDCSEAAEFFRNEKWQAAIEAYAKVLESDPQNLRAYREGILAAGAAEEQKQQKAFLDAARKHLGEHDRNLLEGALRRHGFSELLDTADNKETM